MSDQFKEMLDQAQRNNNSTNNNINFTPDEANKFKKAFEDPEFRKLFSEYLDEMHDPKYRKETEEYISQLENEQKVPEGKELIRPNPLLVVKTKKINNNEEEKLFINIVYSEKINEPIKTNTKQGENWSVPYSLGPPHMEKDKSGDNTVAFDCCFHTKITNFINDKRYENLLVNTASDGIEEYYKRIQSNIKITREYHVVKGINYKSGPVLSMLISSSSKNNWNDNSNQNNNVIKDTNTKKTSNKLLDKPTDASKDNKSIDIKKGFLLNNKSNNEITSNNKKIEEIDIATSTSTNTVKFIQTPKYTFIERGNQGTNNFGDFEAMNRVNVMSNRPNELIYRIELPLVVKASLIVLDIYEKSFNLKYEDVYELTVQFSYPIYDKKGAAKYDKNNKTLTVTLPVQPHQTTVVRDNSLLTVVDSNNNDIDDDSKVESKSNDIVNNKSESKPSHDRWIDKSTSVSNEELKKTIYLEAEKAKTEYLSNLSKQNQAVNSLKEINSKLESKVVTESSSKVDRNEGIQKLDFYPSSVFTGSKTGYYFSMGDNGLGYYKEANINRSNELNDINDVITSLPYSYKQTQQTIGIIIDIESIIPMSVKINFLTNGFDLIFRTITNNIYSSGFNISDSIINPIECRYDIVSKNMAIILTKTNDKLLEDTIDKPLIAIRKYSGVDINTYRNLLFDMTFDNEKSLDNYSDNKLDNEPVVTQVDSKSNKESSSDITVDIVKYTLNEMKINSNVLFELD